MAETIPRPNGIGRTTLKALGSGCDHPQIGLRVAQPPPLAKIGVANHPHWSKEVTRATLSIFFFLIIIIFLVFFNIFYFFLDILF